MTLSKLGMQPLRLCTVTLVFNSVNIKRLAKTQNVTVSPKTCLTSLTYYYSIITRLNTFQNRFLHICVLYKSLKHNV